jgi:hypothetical protein
MPGATARQRGEGRAGLIIALIVVAVAAFAAIKFVPVYIAAYDLRETIRDEVRLAGRSTDKLITERILAKAEEHHLTVDPREISIRRTSNKIFVKVGFDVPIDMAAFTYTYRFDHEESAPLF